ncbi:MAG: protein phosphatase 2C domain-containing protein [Chloroflexota bacterium]
MSVQFYDFSPIIQAASQQGSRGHENDDSYDFFTVQHPGKRRSPIYVAAVADGVTTSNGGAQASRIALDTLKSHLEAGPIRTETISEWLETAVHQANHEIIFAASRTPELSTMSTTVVVAAIAGRKLYVMHMGDSRAYLMRSNAIFQLTEDHTWAQEAMDAGTISLEEAKRHPGRNQLQRFLGTRSELHVDRGVIDPETKIHEEYLWVEPGDSILLSTDGVHGRLLAPEIRQIIFEHAGYPQDTVDELIRAALDRGERDDITALLIEIPPERKSNTIRLSEDEITIPIAGDHSQTETDQPFLRRHGALIGVLAILLIAILLLVQTGNWRLLMGG